MSTVEHLGNALQEQIAENDKLKGVAGKLAMEILKLTAVIEYLEDKLFVESDEESDEEPEEY